MSNATVLLTNGLYSKITLRCAVLGATFLISACNGDTLLPAPCYNEIPSAMQVSIDDTLSDVTRVLMIGKYDPSSDRQLPVFLNGYEAAQCLDSDNLDYDPHNPVERDIHYRRCTYRPEFGNPTARDVFLIRSVTLSEKGGGFDLDTTTGDQANGSLELRTIASFPQDKGGACMYTFDDDGSNGEVAEQRTICPRACDEARKSFMSIFTMLYDYALAKAK